jgi:hypothetical protein
MWIFTSNSFVSIVEHRDDPAKLIIRGRFKGDVDRFLGAPIEIETPDADYRFRATAKRADVEAAITRAAQAINYPNFKGSMPSRPDWRHRVAMQVWRVMAMAQIDQAQAWRRP